MYDDVMDKRTAALAAATAVTVCDATGYADALRHLPPMQDYTPDGDIDADKALFTGSGIAN